MCEVAVGGPDWAGLSHAGRVEALVDLEARMARLHAEQLRLLAVIGAEDPAAAGGRQWVRDEVACALRVSPGWAAERLAQASQVARVPRVLALLAEGSIGGAHVRAVVEAITAVPDDATAVAIVERVALRAPEQTVGAFRRSLKRAVLALAPLAEAAARAHNVAERRVWWRPAGAGVTEVWSLLPDEGAAALVAAVQALAARAAPGDVRTADQRRADALVQLGLDSLATPSGDALPTAQRLRPAVNVSVALSTLLGIDNEPGELDGVGPIPAALARTLAEDPSGTWRRLLTDARGTLIEAGRTAYRPPAPLERHVTARDRTCRFPHCTRAARRCEIDHIRAWAHAGPTNSDNLHVLCPRHHHLKHETPWRVRRRDNGDTVWTSPTGRGYTKTAAQYPIDRTMAGTGNRDVRNDPDPPPS